MPPRTRFSILALAVILALVAAYGLSRIQREYPSDWARILPQVSAPESPAIDLQRALQQISDGDGPKAGSRLPLAQFVQSDGSRILVVLVEGQFFDRSIEPREVWRTLGRDLILVSSVDERRSSTGNLSSPVTAGCAIPTEEFSQQLGSTSINECQGVYRKEFHIHAVARMSAVVEASNADQSPCWARYGISGREADYQTCISNAVASGLGDLFSGVHARQSVDAIILPAIATGTGKLSKAAFYNKLLVDTLVPQLNRDYYIPGTIYLQVWRGDPDKRWPETEIAIAGAVAAAVTTWNFRSEHKAPDSEWLSLTGVAIGSCLMLLILTVGVRFGILSDLLPVVSPFRPVFVVSWISAAVGLVSVFKAVFGFFPAHLNPYLQVAAGALAAFLCDPMTRADDAIRRMLNAGQSGVAEGRSPEKDGTNHT